MENSTLSSMSTNLCWGSDSPGFILLLAYGRGSLWLHIITFLIFLFSFQTAGLLSSHGEKAYLKVDFIVMVKNRKKIPHFGNLSHFISHILAGLKAEKNGQKSLSSSVKVFLISTSSLRLACLAGITSGKNKTIYPSYTITCAA